MAEWLKAIDSSSILNEFTGSNPVLHIGLERFKLSTFRLSVERSIGLSYKPNASN